MAGKMSRDKGLNYERAKVRQLRVVVLDAARDLNDVKAGDKIDVRAGIFDIQCKRYKDYAAISVLGTIRHGDGRIPALITKADYKDDVIALRLADFLRIVKDIGIIYD